MKRSEMVQQILAPVIQLHRDNDELSSVRLAGLLLKYVEAAGMAPPYNQPAQYDGWLEACVAPVGAKREWEPEDV
jgi:hypothetical protein